MLSESPAVVLGVPPQDVTLFNPLKSPHKLRAAAAEEYTTLALQLQQVLRVAAGLQLSSLHPYPLPKTASEAVMSEVQLLGYHPVKASELLIAIWKNGAKLKTVDQLWQERLDQVLAMPEVLSGWGPEQRVQAEQLLCMLASLLAPLGPKLCLPATPEGMRSGMKVLSLLYGSSYHSNVVIPFKPNREAGKAGLPVFEAEYMKSLEAVNRHMRQLGDSCLAGGSCEGDCMPELLMQEAMSGLQKIGVSSARISKCLASHCLKIAGPKISKLGTQAAAAAPNTFPTSLAPEQPPGRFHFNQLKRTAAAAAATGHRNPIQDHIGTVSGMAAPAAAGVVAPSGGIVVQQPNGARV
uniref:Uncharacterized protein n=1 Tax=Tetradesmus obliquus TaxID=3088 RepID=A0A383WEK0_TETOB|eukprot:jgi/Sobl393_1/7074/SZX75690.1